MTTDKKKERIRGIVDDALGIMGIGENSERYNSSRLDFVSRMEKIANDYKVM